MLQDRRRPGAICFANGSPTLDCTVQRSSASGAEVRVPNARSIPQRFELNDGVLRRVATVVWRRSGVLGVRFDDYFSGR
jgi:hypothetical protein